VNNNDVSLFLAETTINKQEKLQDHWWIERTIFLQTHQFIKQFKHIVLACCCWSVNKQW